MVPRSSVKTGARGTVPSQRLHGIISGLLLVILLGALEQTIVAVALPVIGKQLNGFNEMAWVVSAYLIASAVVTPIYGKLSDLFGRRPTLSAAISIFVLASAGCALAQSLPQLIAWRVLQGIGGGGLISVATAAMADVVSPRQRGRYQGHISAVWTVASVAGPAVGGYLTQYLSWHWIFWINLPLGAVAMVMIRRTLPPPQPRRAALRIDYPGALLFAGGVTSLLVAISRIGEGLPASGSGNLLLMGAAVLLLGAFCWHGQRVADPLIPLSMFRIRTVSLCCLMLFICYVLLISLTVILPLRLQLVAGVASDRAAFGLLPLTLGCPLGAFLAGRAMSRSGHYKPLMLLGAGANVCGLVALALIAPRHAGATAIVLMGVGVGVGLQLPSNIVAVQNAVAPGQVGLATALTSFSRLLGGAVGVAVLSSMLTALLRDRLPALHADAAQDVWRTWFSLTAKGGLAQWQLVADQAFCVLLLISAGIAAVSLLPALALHEQPLRDR